MAASAFSYAAASASASVVPPRLSTVSPASVHASRNAGFAAAVVEPSTRRPAVRRRGRALAPVDRAALTARGFFLSFFFFFFSRTPPLFGARRTEKLTEHLRTAEPRCDLRVVCRRTRRISNAQTNRCSTRVSRRVSRTRLACCGSRRVAGAAAICAALDRGAPSPCETSGPARVREVLRWLLGAGSGGGSAARRGVPRPRRPGVPSPPPRARRRRGAPPPPATGELFHDVQLTERCLRRSGGDHDLRAEARAASADEGERTAKHGASGGAGSTGTGRNPTSRRRAYAARVDPPPPADECPVVDHRSGLCA